MDKTQRITVGENMNLVSKLIEVSARDDVQGITFIRGARDERYKSYREVYGRALNILNHLRARGLKPGRHLIMQVADTEAFVDVFWACLLGGIVPVPVTQATNRDHRGKVLNIYEQIDHAFLIFNQPDFSDFEAYMTQAEVSESLKQDIGRRTIWLEDLADFSDQHPDYGLIHIPKPSDVAFIQYSSGSTGSPKGVMLTHENLVINCQAIIQGLEATPADSTLSWMPITHDMGLIGFHLAFLLENIHQRLMPPTLFARRPLLWWQKINEHRATITCSPNFGYEHFLSYFKEGHASDWDLSSVRLIINGAEPISEPLCNRFLSVLEPYGLKRESMMPVYGMAEASVAATFPPAGERFRTVHVKRDSLAVGKAVDTLASPHEDAVTFMDVGSGVFGCDVRIVGDDGQPEDDWVIGQIQISGGNVTQGYFNNSAATESAITSDGWVNTGDLGFMRDGRLVVTGRMKDVAFINGQNLYLYDVERMVSDILSIPENKVVACATDETGTGNNGIAVFLVYRKDIEGFLPLRDKLMRGLTERMGVEVEQVLPISSVVKTTSGKKQRFKYTSDLSAGGFDGVIDSLRSAEAERDLQARPAIVGENPVEAELLSIWKAVFRRTDIQPQQDMFELGATSLRLLELLTAIEQSFGVELCLDELRDIKTIAEMCGFLKARGVSRPLAAGLETDQTSTGDSVSENTAFPLTEVQAAYLIGRTSDIELSGLSTYSYQEFDTRLDLSRLSDALQAVIDHHPMLRAVMTGDGQQKVLSSSDCRYPLPITDATNLAAPEQEALLTAKREQLSQQVADVQSWPLFKIEAVKLSSQRSVLCIGIDLLIADSQSIHRLLADWLSLYHGRALSTLDYQFPHYVRDRQALRRSERYERDRLYWQNKAARFPKAPALPTSFDAQDHQQPRFKRISHRLSSAHVDKLTRLAHHHSVSPSAVFCAAFAKVLGFWCNQADLALNVTLAKREPFHGDIGRVVGDFTSLALIESHLGTSEPFWTLTDRMQGTLLQALQHSLYDGVEFLRDLSREWNTGTAPIMPVVFTSMLFDDTSVDISELGKLRYGVSQTPQVMLDHQVLKVGDDVQLSWDYAENIVDTDWVERAFEHYIELVNRVCEGVDKPLMLPPQNDLDLMSRFNDTAETIPASTLTELVSAAVNLHADRTAIVDASGRLSYRELDSLSNRLAHYWVEQGIGAGDRIGVLGERSHSTLVMKLGILKAGAAYVPIDPDYPEQRKEHIFNHASCRRVVGSGFFQEIDLDQYSDQPLKISPQPDDIAYVIYTSGSTGLPKGVVIRHCQAVNTLVDINKKFGVTEKDCIIGLSSYSFDLSVFDVFGSWAAGATLVIAPDQRDMDTLIELVQREGVTVWNSVPAIVQMLAVTAAHRELRLPIRLFMLSGDWIPLDLPTSLHQLAPECQVMSLGGATECSIWSVYYPVKEVQPDWSSIPYGMPLANQQLHVLTSDLTPCPVGVAGELYIGGAGVGVGYLNDTEKTAAAFIDSDNLGRLYKTGDYARLESNGVMTFLGRKDTQVKIRGFRIELGEIEHRLNMHEAVVQSVVLVRDTAELGRTLCAYVVTNQAVSDGELREWLAAALPSYMVPAHCVSVDEIPLTPNGKVDRKALPEPATKTEEQSLPVGNAVESTLSAWLRERLNTSDISLNQNLFELGMDSLTVQQLLVAVEKEFEVRVSFRHVFEHPTLADIADYILREKGEAPMAQAEPVTEPDSVVETSPCSLADDQPLWWLPGLELVTETAGVRIKGRLYQSDFEKHLLPLLHDLTRQATTASRVAQSLNYIAREALDGLLARLLDDGVLVNSVIPPLELLSLQEPWIDHLYGDRIQGPEDYRRHKTEVLNRHCAQENAGSSVVLNDAVDNDALATLERIRTSREFDTGRPIDLQTLSALLATFGQKRNEDDIRYRYPSAGGLYPMDVYLHVKPGRVEGLDGGVYYYHPASSELTVLPEGEGITDETHHYRNQSIFRSSAFSVFLVYNSRVSAPVYGTKGIFMAAIETGMMASAFGQVADSLDIGVCSIGDLNTADVQQALALNEHQCVYHVLECGLKLPLDRMTENEPPEKETEITDIATYPATAAQKRMFMLNEISANTTYNNPYAYWLNGEVDTARLTQALQAVVDRHETLRTLFREQEGRIEQRVLSRASLIIDRRRCREAELEQVLAGLVRPFDLTRELPLRVALLEVDSGSTLLFFDCHHIAADRSSLSIFIRDLMHLYDDAALPGLTMQYHDYAAWQQQRLNDDNGIDRAYWLETLSGELPALGLPTDFFRPPVQSFEGARSQFSIDSELTGRLTRLASQQGSTLFMLLLAAYKTLLWRYSGQEDIIVGTPIAGRNHAATADMIGMFVNTLALRSQPSADRPFVDYLGQVSGVVVESLDHADYPFDLLVDQLNLERDVSRNPVFDAMFVMQNMTETPLRLAGPTPAHPFSMDTSMCDLTLEVEESDGALRCQLIYASRLFLPDTIERMAQHFRGLLDAVVAQPLHPLQALSPLPESERAWLLSGLQDETQPDYEINTTLPALFEEQAAKTPDQPAVLFGDVQLTYRELDRRANQLAGILITRGARPDGIIAVLAERSLDLVVGLFAIHKAGAAYLPIDPSLPEQRIHYMLEDSGASLLLTTASLQTIGPEETPRLLLDDPATFELDGVNQRPEIRPEHLAYVIYTSGSTGLPKGVMIEHRAIVNRLLWMQHAYPLGVNDVLLQKTPYSFDVSVWELFWWSLTGARLALLPSGDEKDPDRIVEAVERYRVTRLHFVPSMLSVFLDYLGQRKEASRLASVTRVFCSGEALMPAQVSAFRNLLTKVNGTGLTNLYGPTEASVDVSYFDCDDWQTVNRPVPIGRPIDRHHLYVLGANNQIQPLGVVGELCIAGVGLARGYLNLPEKTAQSFVDNPFAPGQRMYRTGDLARVLPDGQIEYLGRIDHQVKVRGYRIELSEIEIQLEQEAEVQEAVVLANQDEQGQNFLCAYVLPAADVSEGELKSRLGGTLPAYMVPAHLLFVDSMPLTANGKVDRRALSKLPLPTLTNTEKVAASTPVESALLTVWCEVFARDDIGVTDNFFALGGDSIKAIRLISVMNQSLDWDLSIQTLYQYPTIRGLARVAEEDEAVTASSGVRDQIELELKDWKTTILEQYFSDGSEHIEDIYPMSDIVHGMVSLSEAKDTSLYHEQTMVQIKEPGFDTERMRLAMRYMVARHDILRTAMHLEGEAFQVVYKEGDDIPLLDIDLSGLSRDDQEARIKADLQQDLNNPFKADQYPLMRMVIYRLDADRVVLCWMFHHAILDGWSVASFITELMEVYHNRQWEAPLPGLNSRYRDYVVDQKKVQQSDDIQAFWKEELTGHKRFPTHHFGVAEDSMRIVNRQVDPELLHQLKALSLSRGIPLRTLCFSAYVLALDLFSADGEFVLGLVENNRPLLEDSEKVLGCFLNTIPFKVAMSEAGGTALSRLFQDMDDKLTQLKHYGRLSLVNIVKAVGESHYGNNPFFDVIFNFVDFHVLESIWDQRDTDDVLDLDWFDKMNTLFNFTVSTSMDEFLLRVSCYYPEAIAHKMMDQYEAILRALVDDFDRPYRKLDFVSPEDWARLTMTFNDTRQEGYPLDVPLHVLFEQRAAQHPDATALEYGDRRVSYQDVNVSANQLAHELLNAGIESEQPVGVFCERSVDMVVSLLAVLKAGAAYVPIDPAFPEDRVDYILNDANVALVMLPSVLDDRLVFSGKRLYVDCMTTTTTDHANPDLPCRPEQLAYLMYTSGSTGRPKGVMIEHRSVVNILSDLERHYPLEESDAILLKTPYTFDVSVTELFGWFMGRGRLVLLPPGQEKDVFELARVIREHGVTHVNFVPSLFGALLTTLHENPSLKRDLESLKYICVAGEALTSGLAQKYFDSGLGARLENIYGPTESTIYATHHSTTPDSLAAPGVPIGKPLGNIETLILDSSRQIQPIGVPGELWLSGAGLARGYWQREALTEERFVPHPFTPGARMYRTGDLARWLPDGNIEYMGRVDDQVKIRGIRIELGEVEAALAEHPDVREAAVIAHQPEDTSDSRQLVGYVVPGGDIRQRIKNQDTAELDSEQVNEWKTVFEKAYDRENEHEADFNIISWNSSYTGLPIPAEEMRVWVDSTVDRILALKPKRLLEIGCGTGLLAANIAPHCERYVATDFSDTALGYIERHLKTLRDDLQHLELLHKDADDFGGFEAGSFDTIVINSVAQYFPDQAYLLSVIHSALSVLAEGGRLFLGDIRSLPLLETFLTDVELERGGDITVDQLQRLVQKRVRQEQELVVDPVFFHALQQNGAGITHVDIQLKRGAHHNEVSRYRYDVTLHLDPSLECFEPKVWLDCGGDTFNLDRIRARLAELNEPVLALHNLINARVAKASKGLSLLHEGQCDTLGDIQAVLKGDGIDTGVDPEDLWQLADELGYRVDIGWDLEARGEGRFSAVFQSLVTAHSARPVFPVPAELEPAEFYTNDPLIDKIARQWVPELKAHLRSILPEYMVPSALEVLKAMPLSASGKIDRKALPLPDLKTDTDYVAPEGDVEALLVDIWQTVLGVEPIGIHDPFFDLGGDSIKGIQVAARLNQHGYKLETRDLFDYPTVAGLSQRVQRSVRDIDQSPVSGELPLTPIQRWFFEQNLDESHHWNQAVMLFREAGFDDTLLRTVMTAIVTHHDALRTVFTERNGQVTAHNRGIDEGDNVCCQRFDLSDLPDDEIGRTIEQHAADIQASFDLSTGPLVKLGIFHTRSGDHLLIAIHHLVVDGVSWRILFEDIATGYAQAMKGEPLVLPTKTDAFLTWSNALDQHSRSQSLPEEEQRYWAQMDATPEPSLPFDHSVTSVPLVGESAECRIELTEAETHQLLTQANRAYNTDINDLLLTALGTALGDWSQQADIKLHLESHGREYGLNDLDISRTVGWFTALYPVLISQGAPEVGERIKRVKEQLRRVPNKGVGYGLYRYGQAPQGTATASDPAVCFNYLGQFDADLPTDLLSLSPLSTGPSFGPGNKRLYHLEINGLTVNRCLQVRFGYAPAVFEAETIRTLTDRYKTELQRIIQHCLGREESEMTPSDLMFDEFSLDELAELENDINQL